MKKRPRAAACDAPAENGDEDGGVASVGAAYEGIDGYLIAREAKRQQRAEGVFLDGLQFGEIHPRAFATALSWCMPQKGERFIDLGSGTGKAVLTAAALHPFESAVGVEIVQQLHDAALQAHARFRAGELQARDVSFECADALRYPWTEADVVFVSLTCFTDEMVAQIGRDALKLRPGARLLVTSRELECGSALRRVRREKLTYGRGAMTFILYERVGD
jgi:precorrin-6B methylase 2